jgi:hypothetical protein
MAINPKEQAVRPLPRRSKKGAKRANTFTTMLERSFRVMYISSDDTGARISLRGTPHKDVAEAYGNP